jgi:hypothetical protein
MRGKEPYVNYKCGACRYSWQVKNDLEYPAKTQKQSPADSDEPDKGE